VASTFINEDRLLEHLRHDCKERMISAAEPVIQEAMKEIEARLREKLGSIVIAMLDMSFDVLRDGKNLRITVMNKD
jgi:hypothetical protein